MTIEEAIENIDIGGPTMVRSAAKNHAYVTIVVDPGDYDLIPDEISKFGGVTFESRKYLAVKAFRHTADYDANIDKYLSDVYLGEKILRISYGKGSSLRSGENPHQRAVFFRGKSQEPSVANACQLHGKELSFNNIVDGDAVRGYKRVFRFSVIKHTNPVDWQREIHWLRRWRRPGREIHLLWQVVNRFWTKMRLRFCRRFVEMIIPGFYTGCAQYLKEKSGYKASCGWRTGEAFTLCCLSICGSTGVSEEFKCSGISSGKRCWGVLSESLQHVNQML